MEEFDEKQLTGLCNRFRERIISFLCLDREYTEYMEDKRKKEKKKKQKTPMHKPAENRYIA